MQAVFDFLEGHLRPGGNPSHHVIDYVWSCVFKPVGQWPLIDKWIRSFGAVPRGGVDTSQDLQPFYSHRCEILHWWCPRTKSICERSVRARASSRFGSKWSKGRAWMTVTRRTAEGSRFRSKPSYGGRPGQWFSRGITGVFCERWAYSFSAELLIRMRVS